jgi:hypothetical protein
LGNIQCLVSDNDASDRLNRNLMKRTPILFSAMLLLALRSGLADVPPGFSWVNLESDKTTMTAVRRALHDPSISAIREVGVENGFALVMTASRETGAPTPDYDRWSIYNVSLKTGMSLLLVSGYGVKLIDWIGAAQDELAITYYDCWECEAATLFTTLRLQKGVGWRARWPDKTQDLTYRQPGAVASMSDLDQDNIVEAELVFAVVSQPNNSFAVGSWLHSRNSKTGKTEDDAKRYSIDPTTNEDRVEKLSGGAALNWEREICTESKISMRPSTGQDSKACRSVLRAQTVHQPASK